MKCTFAFLSTIFCCLISITSCAIGDERKSLEPEFGFRLLYGKDQSICTAYLSELNQYKDRDRPQCPRFIQFKSDLFQKLEWVPLTEDEIYKIADKVNGFYFTGNQHNLTGRYDKTQKKVVAGPWLGKSEEAVRKAIKWKVGHVWKVMPKVDIDNDGSVENVVIWQEGLCTTPLKTLDYRLYIFNDALDEIDEKKMIAVLQHPKKGWPKNPDSKRFRFLEPAMGMFTYKDKVYVDTFPSGYIEATNERQKYDLKVYQHTNSATEFICGYEWIRGGNND